LNALKTTGLPVETGSGGRTKFNRTRLDIPKTHALDAACVGTVDQVRDWNRPVLSIRATGRGTYSRTRTFKNGFPRGYLMRHKRVNGFQTGDWVRAEVPTGKKAGVHVGRVAIRRTGSFNVQTPAERSRAFRIATAVCCNAPMAMATPFQPKPVTEDARRAA
jgi:hypothetical protein